MIYNETVLECFFNPDHAVMSEASNANAFVSYADAKKQNHAVFYLFFSATGQIDAIRYQVKGTPFFIAGAEWMARQVEKDRNGAILTSMTTKYWQDCFDIPRLDVSIAISLSQAATKLHQQIEFGLPK